MKKMNRFPVLGIVMMLLLGLSVQSGCKEENLLNDSDCDCTEIFVTQHIQIIDGQGQLVTDAEVRAAINYNGLIMDVEQYHDKDNGRYCIMTDEYKDYLYQEATWISVAIRRPGTQWAVRDYYFNTDECKCHIYLLRGELTVMFDPQ